MFTRKVTWRSIVQITSEREREGSKSLSPEAKFTHTYTHTCVCVMTAFLHMNTDKWQKVSSGRRQKLGRKMSWSWRQHMTFPLSTFVTCDKWVLLKRVLRQFLVVKYSILQSLSYKYYQLSKGKKLSVKQQVKHPSKMNGHCGTWLVSLQVRDALL